MGRAPRVRDQRHESGVERASGRESGCIFVVDHHRRLSSGRCYFVGVTSAQRNVGEPVVAETWAEMIVPKKSTEDDLAEVVVKNEAKGTVKNVGYRPARQVPMMPSNTNTVAQQQPPPR